MTKFDLTNPDKIRLKDMPEEAAKEIVWRVLQGDRHDIFADNRWVALTPFSCVLPEDVYRIPPRGPSVNWGHVGAEITSFGFDEHSNGWVARSDGAYWCLASVFASFDPGNDPNVTELRRPKGRGE